MNESPKSWTFRARTRPELIWVWDDHAIDCSDDQELARLPALEKAMLNAYLVHVSTILTEVNSK